MEKVAESAYWADVTAKKIIGERGKDHIVSSGWSPSGFAHVGSLREVLTVDALLRAIRSHGGKVKHVRVLDDFDPLRKIPAGVDTKFEEHIGKPYYLVPDPFGKCHGSWGEHFGDDFKEAIAKLGIEDDVRVSHEMYQKGLFEDTIVDALTKLEDVTAILNEISGRELEKDWKPLQILCEKCSKITDSKVASFDLKKKSLVYSCECGGSGEVAFKSGKVKLNWRLDWPARWRLLKVTVEPFGKDHAAAGGSYDSGKELAKKIFKYDAPYAVPYEFVQLKGLGKMSGSKGIAVSANEAAEAIPAEIIRYLILKGKPERHIDFDAGQGLYNTIEEFSQVEAAIASGERHEFSRAYEMAKVDEKSRVISTVPFAHLVSVYQTALDNKDEIKAILERSGYVDQVNDEWDVIERELTYIKKWLQQYAPDNVKFTLQKELPEVTSTITGEQKKFLTRLLELIEANKKIDAITFHNIIYTASESMESAKDGFKAIYLIFFGQDYGPKAGWYLASLPREFVVKRIKEAVK